MSGFQQRRKNISGFYQRRKNIQARNFRLSTEKEKYFRLTTERGKHFRLTTEQKKKTNLGLPQRWKKNSGLSMSCLLAPRYVYSTVKVLIKLAVSIAITITIFWCQSQTSVCSTVQFIIKYICNKNNTLVYVTKSVYNTMQVTIKNQDNNA